VNLGKKGRDVMIEFVGEAEWMWWFRIEAGEVRKGAVLLR
jgi:hypothetical protein